MVQTLFTFSGGIDILKVSNIIYIRMIKIVLKKNVTRNGCVLGIFNYSVLQESNLGMHILYQF